MIDRNVWYRNPEVIFNIIMCAKDREIALLSKKEDVMPVRNIMAQYSSFLVKNLEAFKFFQREYNIYYSLATYKKIEMFSFSPSTRKAQRLAWNENAIANTKAFDFGLDFDADGLDNIKDAWNDCKKVKELLDEYRVPYSVRFSGSKGFHLTIPSYQLPELKITDDIRDELSLFNWLKNLAVMLDLKLGIPTLDMGIFDPRRIWKASYSYVCESGLICLPLTDEQFNHFNLSMVEPVNVLKLGIRNRGDLVREGADDGLKRLVTESLDGKY